MIRRIGTRPRAGTLRVACRDIATTHPELMAGDCAACANGKLCAIYERIERDRAGTAEAARFETSSSLTTMPGAKTGMRKTPS
jgi:hypothetical protein